MELLMWIVLGAIAGVIVNFTMQEKNIGETYIDLLLGITGAIVAGSVIHLFSIQHIWGSYDDTILFLVIGAGSIIWLGRKIVLK